MKMRPTMASRRVDFTNRSTFALRCIDDFEGTGYTRALRNKEKRANIVRNKIQTNTELLKLFWRQMGKLNHNFFFYRLFHSYICFSFLMSIKY